MSIDSSIKRKRALSFWRTSLPPVPPDGNIDASDRALVWGQYFVFSVEPGVSITGDSYVVDSITGKSYATTLIIGNSKMG